MRDSNSNWQHILSEGFSTSAQLLAFLNINESESSLVAEQQFKTRVPRDFAARMEQGNRYDPLLLQVLATEQELEIIDGFGDDPLAEHVANKLPGLIHKYHGRVLLTVTGACAINCRYCFRRHFPYQDNNPGRTGWQPVLDYIANDTSIHEVILSGGDPLLATDVVLSSLLTQLSAISHLTTLRIHSRIPIVLPERVNDGLLQLLAASRLRVVVVLHTNHVNELSASVERALLQLASVCHLLNQSVLLAGVNNDAKTLVALSHRLFACGVLPYYLHVLDKVQGAAHFDVAIDEARLLFKQIQAMLPGYLVPRLACEEAGALHKTLI